MKKTKIMLCLGALACGCVMVACNEKTTTAPVDNTPLLTVQQYGLSEYETKQLSFAKGVDASKLTYSSDNSAVADVDENGNVYAYAIGTANITVKLGSRKSVCEINVMQSQYAVDFNVADDYIKLKQGDFVTVQTSLSLGYDVVTEYELTATSSDDSKVACQTVGNAVRVQGLAHTSENVDVTLICTYFKRNFFRTVEVQVVQDVALAMSKTAVELASYNADGKLVGHTTQATLGLAVYENGQNKTDADIEWRSDNEKVVTVENGVLSAHSGGMANVIASYTSGGVTYDAYCAVSVYTPTIALNFSPKLYINQADGTNVIDLSAVEEFDLNEDGVFVKDITDGEQTLRFTSSQEKYTMDREDLSFGSRLFRIGKTDRIYYEFPVAIYSKVIKTATELINLKDYGVYTDYGIYGEGIGFNNVNYSKYTLDGYFKLGGNIDLTDTPAIAQYDAVFNASTLKVGSANLPQKDQPYNYGFIGTFDGDGYTIKGGTYGWCGLFGYVGLKGVVKNVAFTNCVLNPIPNYYTANVIAGLFCGTLENVLIDVVSVKKDLSWGYSQGVAWHMAGAKLKNCVAYYPQNTGANYPNYSFTSQAFKADPAYLGLDDTVAENCYSISGGQTDPMHGDGAVMNINKSPKFKVNIYAFGTSCADISWSGLDTGEGGYWVLTGAKATFKSSALF